MMPRKFPLANFALIVLLAGCSSLTPLLASRTPTPAPVLSATSTPQPTPSFTAPVVDQPRLLRVWLPARFDPNAGTPSADLLEQRLQDFETAHPGIQVEVRIKNETDILNTLSITTNAAPDVMPDLIALSYSNMQRVASAGYLHPLEGLTTVLQDPDWYAVSRELGHYKNTEFGLPFACDAMLLVYRPAVFESTLTAWKDIFASGSAMAIPVADPKAYFTLTLYLSDGAQLVDGQGTITLNEETLSKVLSFNKNALDAGIVPFEIMNYQTDTQTLQYYHDGKADLAVVWASSDVNTASGKYMPIPGLKDAPYSFADGWMWALAGTNVENQSLAVELAAYLVESSFMLDWTRALGYLPTRPQALQGWENAEMESSLNEVLQSAHVVPVDDTLTIVGPLLHDALVRVFNGEQVEVVARSVMEQMK